jgi:hypothetical protein
LWIEVIILVGVGCYADDLAPDGMAGRKIGGEAFADGVGGAEIFFGQGFVDDEDRRLPFRVGVGEIASGEKRNAQSAEEIGCDTIS